jgi:hypothetical protein
MTIDWDKPIETEEGLPARLLSTDYRMDGETVMLVQIEHEHGSATRVFRKDGTPYWPSTGRIRNRKTKREGWINIYPSGEHGKIRETQEEAERVANTDTVATIKIEWEE